MAFGTTLAGPGVSVPFSRVGRGPWGLCVWGRVVLAELYQTGGRLRITPSPSEVSRHLSAHLAGHQGLRS